MQSSDKKPYLIGIAGASGSGKTSVANILLKTVGRKNCLLFSMDSYYKELSDAEMANVSNFNFDSPDALDLDLLSSHLNSLMEWKTIEMPIYNYVLNKREVNTHTVSPNKIIIFEGILAFYDIRIRNQMDMKIFVDLDRDICLSRRIYRDMIERGRKFDTIIQRYHDFVKPAFEMHIKNTRKYADCILPKGAENSQAIDLIAHHLKCELNKKFNLSLNGVEDNENSIGNSNSNSNGNGNKAKIQEMNGEEVFDKISQHEIIQLPDEKDYKCLKKILTEFLFGTKMAYYKIYMEIMISKLKLMMRKECYSNIVYMFSDTNEEIASKVLKVNEGVITLYEPILLEVNDKLKGVIKQLNSSEKIKSILIVSVYLIEDTVLCLKDISTKINYISLYYGNGLKQHKDYIVKGGFIGDLEGEYQTADYLFSKRNFDDMLKFLIKS